MSLGYGGKCRLILEDEKTAVYEYSVFNWNMEEHKDSGDTYDGTITIEKEYLFEPEIHQRIKRLPSGRKKLVSKRIMPDIDVLTLLRAGKVDIENSQHSFRLVDTEYDYIAYRLTITIFQSYIKNALLPDNEVFLV